MTIPNIPDFAQALANADEDSFIPGRWQAPEVMPVPLSEPGLDTSQPATDLRAMLNPQG